MSAAVRSVHAQLWDTLYHQRRSVTMNLLQGDKCGVWQHSLCVGVNVQEPPDHFFCEWCRVSLADPFWEPRQRAFFPPASMRPTKGQPPAYLTPGEQVNPYGQSLHYSGNCVGMSI